MTEWEPATEAEAALRDALRANDQERYFRILARTDLLLPTTQATAGQTQPGWGTWTSGGRTHVLAFTSATALRSCLGDNAGASRRTAFADLAAGWPNPEWWLAINPGLPVEGYLPAWYVAQLARGEVRLPGRTLGARARLERAESLARARAAEAGRDASTAPAAGAPAGRTPFRAAAPAAGLAVGTETAATAGRVPPAPVALPRRSAESAPGADADPARSRGGEQGAGGRAAPFIPPAADWSTSLGSRTPPARSGPDETAAGNARTASTGGTEAPRRSFFEPASGRGSAPREPLRPGDRAAPPSRFGRSDQPFPRRGPIDGPRDAEATQAFFAAAQETTPPPRPSKDTDWTAGAPATGTEATQPLPPRGPDPQAEEPTRAFGVFGAPIRPPAATGRPGSDPGGERTQPLPPRPRSEPGDPRPVEELPPSTAEPVSGPPAPRRGFTPIVIEGTIIESRDLDPPGRGPTGPVDPTGVPATGWVAPGTTAPNGAGSRGPRPGAGGEDLWSPSRPGSTRRDAQRAEPHQPSVGAGAGGDPWTPRSGSAWMHPKATGSPRLGDVPADYSADPTLDLRGAGSSAPAHRVEDAPVDLWTPRSDRLAAAGAAPPVGATEDTAPTTGGERATDTASAPDGEATTAFTAASEADADDPTTGVDEPAVEFQPANAVEEELLGAAGAGSTDTFLSTLLLARVLLPVAADSAPGSRPGEPGFVWRTEELDAETFVVVYTSPERLAERVGGDVETAQVKFVQLIRRWPNEAWSFAVNPGTPVGAKLPGEQIIALASWAAEVGLGDDVDSEESAVPAEPATGARTTPKPADPSRPVMMQKAVAPSQVAYYLERGYDRVSGFVHRANELAHLNTPAQLYDALGLNYAESPFSRDAEEIYVLRWPAYRPSLYRIPYGGQNEAAMRAMEGWVIERPPFRGNGFAPGESSDVVAEFKVDSARLPHGAQLWRVGSDGNERVVAILDSDALRWREVDAA
ncbi:SseB family protein [Micromonospora avicenniae]|uniref:SseB family protein n=1 Tax=Micromonospora avicenniae TaxID=1198245 RepID=UPI00097125B8|nr:SseB family protein [Micromonospora avicenniae]